MRQNDDKPREHYNQLFTIIISILQIRRGFVPYSCASSQTLTAFPTSLGKSGFELRTAVAMWRMTSLEGIIGGIESFILGDDVVLAGYEPRFSRTIDMRGERRSVANKTFPTFSFPARLK
jgi:hypothetical protein